MSKGRDTKKHKRKPKKPLPLFTVGVSFVTGCVLTSLLLLPQALDKQSDQNNDPPANERPPAAYVAPKKEQNIDERLARAYARGVQDLSKRVDAVTFNGTAIDGYESPIFDISFELDGAYRILREVSLALDNEKTTFSRDDIRFKFYAAELLERNRSDYISHVRTKVNAGIKKLEKDLQINAKIESLDEIVCGSNGQLTGYRGVIAMTREGTKDGEPHQESAKVIEYYIFHKNTLYSFSTNQPNFEDAASLHVIDNVILPSIKFKGPYE